VERASSHPLGERQAEGSFMYLMGSEVGTLEEFGCAPSLKGCNSNRTGGVGGLDERPY
jgi:hypothetical protein